VKLQALVSVALIAAFGAPAVFAADAQPQPAWYTMAQHRAALEQAVKLGRPIAILWYADTQKAGPPGQWIDQWKTSDLPKQFVCIISESKIENQKIMVDPLVMKLLKANTTVPLLRHDIFATGSMSLSWGENWPAST